MDPTLEFARNPLTCLTCCIMFREVEVRNKHYKSEWHRYNLNRKVANLPSITFDEFERRTHKDATGNQTKQSKNCNMCRKKFSSEKQYENHLTSKKHKQRVKEMDEDQTSSAVQTETEMDVSDASDLSHSDLELENPIERNNCLFCEHHSRSITRNLKHMMVEHSFFVPDLEYCIDKRGLLTYLGEKIYAEYKCIWCDNSGRQLRSADAVKAHMIDKGHCKMLFEGEALLEYLQFYDYTSSYPDAGDADPDEELSEVPDVLLDNDGYELELPSGKVIGHRALVRYYKQNLPTSGTITVAKNGHKLRKFMLQYRALGGPELQAEAIRKRARDVRYLQRVQTKYSTQLQFKQNKLQKHFRAQVNF
ncbi:hypothetical protein DMN91_004869 [Ooceraea biroi]|uniref:C2H2-type domain-containing protein n=1 Tax=Ooceraea biroi TaxID=2015173 RepID=A0A026X1G9_OOCBI|nr:zinc finger protein 622 [Ooceraea biroi]XP_011351759.1 zinc finger protein 622 [Ooceraea biroi]XP_026825647.1 zinc finger protein 622 [Ooceraea biroi]EZA61234.1 hypothetical protein X777_08446 [Ooceraea biroi]RLU22591.1 hypothetical protein DMN91_004869 [Ooceraea biroi]